MSNFSATIQILAVENEMRKGKKPPFNEYQHFAARSILLDDAGNPVTVGSLRTRNQALQALCSPGTYRAGFSLQVPDFGDDKGDICAVLTSLTPVPVKGSPVPQSPSK